MSDDFKRGLQQAIFHGVKNSIHTEGNFTYKIYNVFQNELEDEVIYDKGRLKKRLLKEIIKKNNARADRYPNAQVKRISETTPFKLSTFQTSEEGNSSSAGGYALFPMEFICRNCGKIYDAKSSSDLKSIPSKCACGGKLEQNTIALFCEDCGAITQMGCTCSQHGKEFAYLDRKTKDDISTWVTYCKKCRESGGKPVDFLRYPCWCKGKRKPLPVRDGGIYTPVSMTFIDLQHKPTGEMSDFIRIAVENESITYSALKTLLPPSCKMPEDILELIGQIQEAVNIPMLAENYVAANQYVLKAATQVQIDYAGVELDNLNDVRFVRDCSISFDDYLNKLPEADAQPLKNWYQDAKRNYGLCDIRYAKDLKVIMSSIGQISGINRFYEEGFVPHFEPFRDKKDSEEIYAMVVPIVTEGILFRLDPVKVCNWLHANGLIKSKVVKEGEARNLISHFKTNSDEYRALKMLVHSLSHILIKQSNIYTGLDENTCAELIFPLDASFLIYSTSSVNIGGFEYAFNYSLPNWFSRIKDAAEDCVFDPTCMKEGGRCFSCMHVTEFVCCNFNKDLSRHTLIGGDLYPHGFWKS